MLFQKNIIKKYLSMLPAEQTAAAWEQYSGYFLNAEIQQNIRQSKEEQFQEGFLRELFVKVLGYTLNPSPGFNLITEKKNETNSKKADGAILLPAGNGTHSSPSAKTAGETPAYQRVIGVIELKDHKTTDLSKVEGQAFGYKSQHVGTRLVIISNFEKLRLYIDNAVEHREWNLFTLSEQDFRELYLCLAWSQIEKGTALQMKQESVSSEDQITNALYRDYSQFKRVLFADIVKNNPYPGTHSSSSAETAGETPAHQKEWQLLLFKKTQKLLDRLLFIFFAEDGGLLPPNSMVKIIEQWVNLRDEYDEYQPFYARVKKYFGYMNTGFQGKKYEIFAYNGGLFKPDEVLDSLTISDDLLVDHTRKLSEYDFESDVDVNILGHIFENSLSEIEEVTQQINSGTQPSSVAATAGETPAYHSKRKQDGVFYTPQYITKYIVENTVGRLCAEKKQELHIDEAEYFFDKRSGKAGHSDQRRQMQTKKRLLEQLHEYREWLLQITILDPACGSGAFLNAALRFLMDEHKLIDEMEAKVTGSAIVFQDVENSILEHNLYGVDINEESVEIAQLALWLRTAKPHRKLNTLSQNIKCGNSLISDPAVAGEKAFDWQKEFPQVFGGTQPSSVAATAGETPAYHNHSRKYLPHIENQHLQFITFRLYDSLPKEVIEAWKEQIGYDKKKDEKSKADDKTRQLLTLIDKYEDSGYGQCFFSDERVAQIMADALHFYDAKRYNLISYCIMPNHVHVLIEVLGTASMSEIVHGWRSFTAHEANKVLGRKGDFWMNEYFDRYIRNEKHFETTLNYIANNPVKAGLVESPSEWHWWWYAGTHSSSSAANVEAATEDGRVPFAAGETPAYQQGFDVVIGNPPYVRADSPGNSLDFRNYMTSCGRWETLAGKWDLYIPFLELGVKLTKPGGLCSFIIPDAYCHAEYGKRSLEWMKSHHYLSMIDYFPDIEVFENVGVKSVIVNFDKRRAGTHSSPSAANAVPAGETIGTHSSPSAATAVSAGETIGTHSSPSTATAVPAGETPAYHSAGETPAYHSAGETPAYQFVQRIHDNSHQFTERCFNSYPDNLRIDAKPRMLEGREGMIPLGHVCYITKGIVGNSDEKQYKGEFLVGNLLSELKDEAHPKLYYEGKDIGSWRLLRARYIEYGTERSPGKWSRKGFTEMFEGSPKLVTMRSPGSKPRTFLDTDNGYFNESAIGFKRWIDLKGVENNSVSKAYSDKQERAQFEELSANYTYKTLLAIFNSSLIRYELNTERRSNIHIYPDDWKRIVLPWYAGFSPAEDGTHSSSSAANVEAATEDGCVPLDTLADTMLALHEQLQSQRSRFLRRLSENLEGVKITTALQTFDQLTFADFTKELKKQKIKLSPLEQDQWEEYFDHYAAACGELTKQITATDKEIDLRVYRLYSLTYDEVRTVDPETTITKEEYEQ